MQNKINKDLANYQDKFFKAPIVKKQYWIEKSFFPHVPYKISERVEREHSSFTADIKFCKTKEEAEAIVLKLKEEDNGK